ncbi:MAG: sulfatase-like hydrolase/transferase, partial [Holophagales bacterium]|nr:sulfatase-like hydrolase/transferase [Holophagales bacterium]
MLLITVDTLRADSLGFAGHPHAHTPNLDLLAARGRVFTFAHAHSVMTLPSHANLLTGLLPHQHGVRDNGGFVLGDDVPTLATLLAQEGFATAAFVASYPLDARYGLGRGFHVYDDVELPEAEGSGGTTLAGGLPDPRRPYGERRGDEVVALALEWWRSHATERRFLWLHLFDPHGPYLPPSPWAERFPGDPYLGEVAATDAFLGPLLEPLLEPGAEGDTLVVFTSDHGESLGEHGELTHGLFAYGATLEVPLVVFGPGIEAGTDPFPARHVDVLPTVLDHLGIPLPPTEPGREPVGRSLLREASGDDGAIDTYFEALSANLAHGWAPLRGMIRGRTKVIELPIPELYDLENDPDETENLVDSKRRAYREIVGDLPRESRWPPDPGSLDPEEAARLRSLGYLASRGSDAENTFGPEDDPKRLVDLDRALKEVLLAFYEGDLDRSIRLCRQVLERRADLPLAHTYLALSLLRKGRPDLALAAMEQAVAADAAAIDLRRQMGITLLQVDRAPEAIVVLEAVAAEQADAATVNNLALALAATGRLQQAVARLEAFLEQHPENSGSWENLAFLSLESGDPAAAEEAARRSTTLSPERPGAWNNLGLALYGQGRFPDAMDAWRRVLELEPGNADTLFNLGTVAAEAGDAAAATNALERFLQSGPAPADPRTEAAR